MTGPTTFMQRRTAFSEPGKFTTMVLPFMPATPRDSTAAGVSA